jgi:uncharacterized lipoprotein
VLIAATLLNGCSWFHRDRVEYYKGAAESRPLEVPPDLDTPTSSKELVVPGASAAGAPAAAATGVSTVPPASTAAAATGATELRVADTVENTWRRVGLALDRAQLGKISGRDETNRSYVLDFNSTVASEPAPAPEHHWYSRILHPFGGGNSGSASTQQVTTGLRITITEDAGGARISVIGNSIDKTAPDAARRVIQVLRERLS